MGKPMGNPVFSRWLLARVGHLDEADASAAALIRRRSGQYNDTIQKIYRFNAYCSFGQFEITTFVQLATP